MTGIFHSRALSIFRLSFWRDTARSAHIKCVVLCWCMESSNTAPVARIAWTTACRSTPTKPVTDIRTVVRDAFSRVLVVFLLSTFRLDAVDFSLLLLLTGTINRLHGHGCGWNKSGIHAGSTMTCSSTQVCIQLGVTVTRSQMALRWSCDKSGCKANCCCCKWLWLPLPPQQMMWHFRFVTWLLVLCLTCCCCCCCRKDSSLRISNNFDDRIWPPCVCTSPSRTLIS